MIQALGPEITQELDQLANAIERATKEARRPAGQPAQNRRREFRLEWDRCAPKEYALGDAVERAIFGLPVPNFGNPTATFKRRLREDRKGKA